MPEHETRSSTPPKIEEVNELLVGLSLSGDDVEGREVRELPPLVIARGSRPSPEHPKRNEDWFVFSEERRVAAVFDGLGGHDRGDVAAKLAAEAIVEFFGDNSAISVLTREEAEDLVSRALHKANNTVLAENIRLKTKMQTTGVVAFFGEDGAGQGQLTIDHVGDSRACIYRKDGKLEQLTLDHSNVSKGRTEEEARKLQLKLSNVTESEQLNGEERDLFDNRHRLTCSLGRISKIEVRANTISVKEGDRILLASDGVTDNLTHDEIERILSIYPNNKQAVEELIAAAFLRSKSPIHGRANHDDITAVMVQVGEEGQVKPLEYSSPEELDDEFSWWNMRQALLQDGNYIDVGVNFPGRDERCYIAEVNQFEDSVIIINVKSSLELYGNSPFWIKMSRNELIKFTNPDDSFAKEGDATVVFVPEEEADKSI